MKEPHIEGVATHDDPESCATAREGRSEALTGARAGSVLSRENRQSGTPTQLLYAEGNTLRGRHRESPGGPARSETRSTLGTFSRENREVPRVLATDGVAGRAGKADGRTPAMHALGKSDRPVLPTKFPNKKAQREPEGHGEPYTGTKAETPDTAKGAPTAPKASARADAEEMEGRGLAKGNTAEQNAHRTQCRGRAPSELDRVREAANASASIPEAGAQCGSSARWDLCGGRPEPKGEGRPYRDVHHSTRAQLRNESSAAKFPMMP